MVNRFGHVRRVFSELCPSLGFGFGELECPGIVDMHEHATNEI